MGSGLDGALYATDSNGNLNVFYVERNDNDQWLNTNYDNADNFWNGSNRWVFVRRYSLHFSPTCWESFVFAADRTNRLAFCQSRPLLPIRLYIYCYQAIWFPRVSSKIFLMYQLF